MNCALPPPAEACSRAPAGARASCRRSISRCARLRPLLADPDVTELCINRPREAFIETRRGLAPRGARRLPISTGAGDWRSWSPTSRASAWTNPRRCCRRGCRAGSACRSCCRPRPPRAASRSPSAGRRTAVWSIEELAQPRGLPRRGGRQRRREDTDAELLRLHAARDYDAFMRLAVRAARTSSCPGPPARARPPGRRR